ncbi:MAG: TolC family outer membrane protein [Pseudomonadota bacterium]
MRADILAISLVMFTVMFTVLVQGAEADSAQFDSDLDTPLDTPVSTLGEALKELYQSNPLLNAARADVREADAMVHEARGAFRPSVRTVVEGGRLNARRSQRAQPSSTNVLDRHGVTLNIVQNLYNGGSDSAALRAARVDLQIAGHRLVSTEQQLFLQGSIAFRAVIRDQRVRELNASNVERLQNRLTAVQDLFTVGQATPTELAQARSRLAIARADLARAQGELDASIAIFKQFVGLTPGELVVPVLDFQLPNTLDEALIIGQEENPDILAAEGAVAGQRYRLRQARGDLLPDIDLRAQASYIRDSVTSGDRSENLSLLGVVTIPIYQQGIQSSQVRGARAQLQAREYQLLEARRVVEATINSSWYQLQARESAVEANRQGVEAARIALQGVGEENRIGERSLLDVLDSEQDLRDAEVALENAMYDLLVARLNLLHGLGQLTFDRFAVMLGMSADSN